MKLTPKDPYAAMLFATVPGCQNIRSRKQMTAQELKALSHEEIPQHWKKIQKLEKQLSSRQRKIVDRLLHVYANNLGAAEELGLPKNMQKFLDAHINAHYIEMAIDHDRLMLANMY